MNKTFNLRTKFKTTYHHIHDWEKWSINENFVQFQWGKDKKGILIIHVDDIESIEENL